MMLCFVLCSNHNVWIGNQCFVVHNWCDQDKQNKLWCGTIFFFGWSWKWCWFLYAVWLKFDIFNVCVSILFVGCCCAEHHSNSLLLFLSRNTKRRMRDAQPSQQQQTELTTIQVKYVMYVIGYVVLFMCDVICGNWFIHVVSVSIHRNAAYNHCEMLCVC